MGNEPPQLTFTTKIWAVHWVKQTNEQAHCSSHLKFTILQPQVINLYNRSYHYFSLHTYHGKIRKKWNKQRLRYRLESFEIHLKFQLKMDP